MGVFSERDRSLTLLYGESYIKGRDEMNRILERDYVEE